MALYRHKYLYTVFRGTVLGPQTQHVLVEHKADYAPPHEVPGSLFHKATSSWEVGLGSISE